VKEGKLTQKEVNSAIVTDREAAERAGIDPGRAAYVKAKPKVKDYMEQHRASVGCDHPA
jgi:hypothetical protein